MAGEKNPSVFSRFGNQRHLTADNPPPVPVTRKQVSFDEQRKLQKIPPASVFQGNAYAPADPSVFSISLATAQTDVEYPINGNVIWFQSSTNPTDVLSVKFNRTSNVAIPLLPGNALFGIPFQKLFISNSSIGGATATLIVMQDTPEHPIRVL